MQYMLLIYSQEGSWDGMTEEQQQQGMAAYTAYGDALEKAGAFVGADRLEASTSATTVSLKSGKRAVMDGPYADTKEQLAGYYIVNADNLDGALEWAARCPGAQYGTMEVRPIFATRRRD